MPDDASPAPPPVAAPGPLVSGGHRLEWHLARPPSSAARDATRTGLVVAHGMPSGPGSGVTASQTYPELADRVARETGWAALSFSFRGAGLSPGQFSPAGWLEDLTAAVAHLRSEVSTVWLAGFGFGGTLALRLSAVDPEIGGVAALATPSDLSPWIADPIALAAAAHGAGILDTPAPEGIETWAADLRAMDPLRSAAAVPPRPLLIVHGSADAEVALVEARALADAAEGQGDLRVVANAGHRLRHDPRVVAILLGWLERGEG
ncbi:MAG TPA: alpha/beta hydrolase [Acidimicrobiales bacterium]